MRKIIIGIVSIVLLSCQSDEISNENDINFKTERINTQSSISNKVDWKFQYVDLFDGASNNNDYGLNSNLNERHLYGDWQGIGWIRKSGFWGEGKIIKNSLCQVNNPHYTNGNTLTFHKDMSAIMLDKRIWPGNSKRYRVEFDTDPGLGDKVSGDWTSFMLDNSQNENGFVTKTDFGFLISSHGGIQVFKNGVAQSYVSKSGNFINNGSHHIILDISPSKLIIDINHGQVTYEYGGVSIESAHPYLGAYYNPASTNTKVSSFDNLVINTPNDLNVQHIKHYGYYWAKSCFGDYLSSIEDFTNLNFLQKTSDLQDVPSSQKYIVPIGVFSNKALVPNWEANIENALNVILANEENKNKVAYIYLIDEPFHNGITIDDYNKVLTKAKDYMNQQYPGLYIPIATNFAYVTLDKPEDHVKIDHVLSNLDYVSFNRYTETNFSTIKDIWLNRLTEKVNWYNGSKKMFLTPQSYNSNTTRVFCGNYIENSNGGGDLSDGQISKLNWEYYKYALENVNTIGIHNFGYGSHAQIGELPITFKTQELIGNSIVNY